MSKKDDTKKGVGPAYPMQPTAPYAVMQGPQLHPAGAPPTYSMMHQTMQPPGHYQEQPMQPYIPGGSVPQAPQVYPQQTQPYPMQNYPYPPQMHTYAYGPPLGTSYMPAQTQTVFVPGLFDAGARFDAGASSSIPPPPPGVAPNAAQLAAMQGQTVVGTQQKSSFFIDGSGGKSTFW